MAQSIPYPMGQKRSHVKTDQAVPVWPSIADSHPSRSFINHGSGHTPPQPNPYSVVHDAPKPGSIKVFGILNIVFGAIGLICGGFGFLTLVIMQSSSEMGDAIQSAMSAQYSQGYMTFIMFTAVIGLLLNIFLLTCGIGLLKERNWGRTWSLGYAVLGIIHATVSAIGAVIFAQSGPAAIGAGFGAIIGTTIGVIYPICILIFLTRPNVVEALKE